ncbi:MAG: aminoacyl-tRNA hydrolase [candidate division Zixibacteria bacterium]|nr:aminoacyl-tRNA hydrolase [candidate division Zixibacteria bacterium]
MLTLILGLGNIGKKYDHTRHNLGFEVVDRVVEKIGAKHQRPRANYEWWRGNVEDKEIILAKPTTFMNCSGDAAQELLERLGITPTEMLVIVDDFNLPLGAVRFRKSGSDGGHNGLTSIIESVGTQEFPRLRLGIGAPSGRGEVIDYVLSRFTRPEKPIVEKMLAIAAEGVIFAVQHRLELAMSKFNSNPALSDLA